MTILCAAVEQAENHEQADISPNNPLWKSLGKACSETDFDTRAALFNEFHESYLTNIDDSLRRLRKTTYEDESEVETTYDALGRLVSRTVDGAATVYDLDAAGNRQAVTSPEARTVSYSFDAAGRVTAMVDAAARLIAAVPVSRLDFLPDAGFWSVIAEHHGLALT